LAAPLSRMNLSAHWRHLSAMRFQVSLVSESRVNFAMVSQSEARLRNFSFGGCKVDLLDVWKGRSPIGKAALRGNQEYFPPGPGELPNPYHGQVPSGWHQVDKAQHCGAILRLIPHLAHNLRPSRRFPEKMATGGSLLRRLRWDLLLLLLLNRGLRALSGRSIPSQTRFARGTEVGVIRNSREDHMG
jgi:hypothetical protein